MDRRIKAVFIVLVAGILVMDLIGCILFFTKDQLRLNSPVGGMTYGLSFLATGDAWTSDGLPPVEVRAVNTTTGETLVFPAERLTVKHRGAPLYELAIYSSKIQLPQEGEWEFAALMQGRTGRARTITARAGAPSHLFTAFGSEHVIVLSILAALMAAVIIRYRKPRGDAEKRAVSLVIALVLLAGELSYHIYWVAIGAFSASNSLMFHMCSLALFFVPFLLFMKEGRTRQWLFEIAWFWGLGGAVQACLAADVWTHSFPELRFFTFFASHIMLILGALFFALTTGSQLTFKSLLRAGAVTLGMTAFTWGIDQALRLLPPHEPGNYFFMGYPPPTGSVIDVFSDIFGPSPWYVIGLMLMGIVLFTVIYLPFPIYRRLKGKASAA